MFSLGDNTERRVLKVFDLWFMNHFDRTGVNVRASDFYCQRVINGIPSQEMWR